MLQVCKKIANIALKLLRLHIPQRMKPSKDFRSFDSTADGRKSPKLAPIHKSGKERHNLYDRFDDEDDEPIDYRPRESARDYYDDGDEE